MTKIRLKVFGCCAAALLFVSCACGAWSGASQTVGRTDARQGNERQTAPATSGAARQQGASSGSPFLDKFVEAALDRLNYKVRYDPTYFVIAYPNGDVPAEVGVCTDEVIRAYRKLGVDLQREVHEDMRHNFKLYPRKWGLKKPDTNIDHRRVPNLRVFFERKGVSLPVTADAKDYRPGDVVTWDLGGGLTHIGIVVNVASSDDSARMLIVHNIGAGPRLEDILFNWKITGHYRYTGPAS